MPTNKSAHDAIKGIGSTVKKLGMSNDGKAVETGQHLKKADAQKPLNLSMPDGKGPYVVIMLDMDAPYVSLPFLAPILHWVQSGFHSDSTATLTSEGVQFICDYIAPNPPPGSGPHRYCYFVYDQPADFDHKNFAPPNGQPYGLTKRMFTDLDAYEKKLNLGPVVACNYYTSN